MSCQASVHPLSILNRITYHYQIQMATMYAFADAGSTAIEKGRAAVLAQYCAFAGQLLKCPGNVPVWGPKRPQRACALPVLSTCPTAKSAAVRDMEREKLVADCAAGT